jgi:hypothetical protein
MYASGVNALPRARKDPELRPGPIGPEKRGDIIALDAGRRRESLPVLSDASTTLNKRLQARASWQSRKTWKDDPSPFGSGKKYKRCCGGVNSLKVLGFEQTSNHTPELIPFRLGP